MTKSVCFRCGRIKWGSFTRCEHCGTAPASDDELLQSLVLSDHYYESSQLDQFSLKITKGVKITIAQSVADQLLPAIQKMKPRLKLERRSSPGLVKNGQHLPRDPIASYAPQNKPKKWRIRPVWTFVLLFLAVSLYVLIHG